MSPRFRLFLVIAFSGFIGVLSFQLVDIAALIAKLPIPPGQAPQMSMAFVRVLSIVQPGVLVLAAAFVGLIFAPKVGLSAPAAQAFAERRAILPALRPQLLPGVLGALIAGPAIIATWLLWKPFLTPAFVAKAEDFNHVLPPVTRLLYGGITEEVLLRWGFMSFLVWLNWRLLQRGQGQPRPACFVIGILLSAVIFGAGHLPIAVALQGSATPALVSYVVFANSIFGVVAGYLYWKKGLESAVVAHALTHVVFLAALALM